MRRVPGVWLRRTASCLSPAAQPGTVRVLPGRTGSVLRWPGCAVPPYFWNFIVKRRTGRSTHIGNTLQKGIQARFHQSGTMHRLPLHNAFSPLRAQLSGVMSTPSLQPMRCQ